MSGGAVDGLQFSRAMTRFLAKTPLTDLATCHRASPPFAWGSESLGFVATLPGRALAMRALARGPKGAVDANLGRATRTLVAGRAWRAVGVALDLLAERARSDAQTGGGKAEVPPPPKDIKDDATYARCAGALVAYEELQAGGVGFSELDRAELMVRLSPLTSSPAAHELAAELTGATSSGASP